VCSSCNTVTITGSHTLVSTLTVILTVILHGQSHLYNTLYILSYRCLSNSLSIEYCCIANRNPFMLGYKLPDSITELFLSNINISLGCWNIRMAVEPFSHPLTSSRRTDTTSSSFSLLFFSFVFILQSQN
jgi:hypothetical protein